LEDGVNAQTPVFYVTGGTLRHDAPSYVERGADRELFDGLLRGEFCYVLTSRQMGKSSLMVRTASTLRDQGVVVVVLDLTSIGQNVTPEQWYHGLLMRVGRQLELEDALERFWDAHPKLSPVQQFFGALRDVVLGANDSARKLVVFVDEIDVVRSLAFNTDEFFAAIRECYNRRTEDNEFNRLTFCLLGVATPSDLIRDTRITPFNIGKRIELNDFTAKEVAPLGKGLPTPQLLDRILYWTNGHPYLTQRLCQTVAGNGSGVDKACEELFFTPRAREKDDNLIFVRERLLHSEVDRAGLLLLYQQIWRRKRVRDDETNWLINTLHLSGIVHTDHTCLSVRNPIYARAFDAAWVAANLPEAEIRRQKVAYRRGIMLLAILSLIPMFLVQFYTVVEDRRQGVNNARVEALRLVRMAAQNHDQSIESARQLLTTLAELEVARQRNAERCQTLFANLLRSHRIYANLGLMSPDGKVVAAAEPLSGPTETDQPEFFRKAVASSRFEVGEYRVSKTTHKATVNVGYPVFDPNGDLLVVVFASLDLNWLYTMLGDANLPAGSSLTVIDRNHITLLRYPDPEGRFIGEPLRTPSRSQPRPSERTMTSRGGDGVLRLYAFAKLGDIEEEPAGIAVGIPIVQAHALANATLRRNLILLILGSLFALTLAWFAGEFFVLRWLRRGHRLGMRSTTVW
jgi:hypothetical protein